MRKLPIVVISILMACFTHAVADVFIPRLKESELHAKILEHDFGLHSLDSILTLRDFKEVYPEENWDSHDYSELRYFDEATGKRYLKGLTVAISLQGIKFIFVFEDREPDSLLAFTVATYQKHDGFASVYESLLSRYGYPLSPQGDKDEQPKFNAHILRNWLTPGENHPRSLAILWTPWNDEIIITAVFLDTTSEDE